MAGAFKQFPRHLEEWKWRKPLLFVCGILITVAMLTLAFYPAVIDAVWRASHWSNYIIAFSRDSELLFQVGEYNFNGGAYDTATAERAYRKTLGLQPDFPWANHQLARVSFVQSKMTEAYYYIGKELEYHPDHAQSYYVRGLIRGFGGDLPGAESDFKTFVGMRSAEWAGYNDLDWILLSEEKWQEAKEVALRGLGAIADKNNPWLLNSLGVAELNLKNYTAAHDAFSSALALAERLTIEEWVAAYPGNNPKSAENGLKAFVAAVQKNLKTTEEKNNISHEGVQ